MTTMGMFVAVVGPSGAGKDTILDYAREALGARDDVVFVRRTITRPAGPGEEYDSVTERRFDEIHGAGGFALTWGAHGLRYGIPIGVDADLASGRAVVANVSREAIAPIRERFDSSAVVLITAPSDLRLERILSRGRESAEAAAARVARPSPEFLADIEIVNDGAISDAGDALVSFLSRERAFTES